jgi:hypothetical protein
MAGWIKDRVAPNTHHIQAGSLDLTLYRSNSDGGVWIADSFELGRASHVLLSKTEDEAKAEAIAWLTSIIEKHAADIVELKGRVA